jgi:two-component system, chemotaxis family, chemotaxis protein CheY
MADEHSQSGTIPPGTTIVLVDDDVFLLNIYAGRFSKNGYAVNAFSDPLIALQKIQAGLKPQILVMDLIMPGITGSDFLKKIRAEKLIPDTTTVVVLTNQSDSASMDEIKKLGVDGYIIKATSIPSEVVSTVEILAVKHQPKA